MSRTSDLGPLPMNWRDAFQTLYNLQTKTEQKEENTSPSLTKRQRDMKLLSLSCGRLIRCGQLCPHHDRETIGNPGVIINLRYSNDAERSYHPSLLDSKYVQLYHVPAENSLEKYDTSNREVAKWIASGLRRIQDAPQHAPILVHCRSGKDRTGVLVAAALLAIGIEASLVKSEFLISTGTEERWIDQAIQGLIGKGSRKINDCDLNRLPWLRGVDVPKLRCVLTRGPLNDDDDDVKEGSISWSTAVIDAELPYLRQQNHVFEQHVKPFLEQKKGLQQENTDIETILLCRINDISARQIFLLSLKRDIVCEERQKSDSELLTSSPARSKISKKLAMSYARRGWSFKLMHQYKEALLDFTAAVREAEEITSEINNGDNSNGGERFEDDLLYKWNTQIKLLAGLVDM